MINYVNKVEFCDFFINNSDQLIVIINLYIYRVKYLIFLLFIKQFIYFLKILKKKKYVKFIKI